MNKDHVIRCNNCQFALIMWEWFAIAHDVCFEKARAQQSPHRGVLSHRRGPSKTHRPGRARWEQQRSRVKTRGAEITDEIRQSIKRDTEFLAEQ